MYTGVSSSPSSGSPDEELPKESVDILNVSEEQGEEGDGNERNSPPDSSDVHRLPSKAMSTFRLGKPQLHTLIPAPPQPVMISNLFPEFSPLSPMPNLVTDSAMTSPSPLSHSYRTAPQEALPLPASMLSQSQLRFRTPLSDSQSQVHPLPFPILSRSNLSQVQHSLHSSQTSSLTSIPTVAEGAMDGAFFPYPSNLPSPSFQSTPTPTPPTLSPLSSPSLPPFSTQTYQPSPQQQRRQMEDNDPDNYRQLDTTSFFSDDDGTGVGGFGTESTEMVSMASHLFPARVRNQVSSGVITRAAGGTLGPNGGWAESVWADTGDTNGNSQEGRVMLVDGDGPNNTRWFESLRIADKQIKKRIQKKKVCWVDIKDITPDDIKLLETDYGVHALTAEDLIEKESREKTETFEEYRCLVVHEPFLDDGRVFLQPYILLICPSVAITVRSTSLLETSTFIDPYQRDNSLEALKSIREAKSGMPQPAWVMYAILDCIIDSYIPIVASLTSEAGLLDQLALTLSPDDQQDFLTRTRMARSKLAKIRTTLLVKREILNQLTARGYVSFVDDLTKVYLRDVIDELHQLLSKLDVTAATLNSFPSVFLARLSADSSSTANEVGTLIRTFTIISGMFALFALVTGIFGMNVKIPGGVESEDNFIMFGTICGCLGLFFIGFLGIARRQRWI